MTRRELLAASLAVPLTAAAESRIWRLGLNTYCLRFEKWNDRELLNYCVNQKLDAMFLQDSLDASVNDPKHWTEVREWSRAAGVHLETGGPALLPRTEEAYPTSLANLRKNIDRAKAMGSPSLRTLVASDRYAMPLGPVEKHIGTVLRMLREARTQAVDAGIKISIENHKDLQAWQTRELIDAAGTDFVGSYLDTGNPVFVAEDPMTAVEELGPVAVSFHLRDSVVYEVPGGVAVQWVPLGEGTMDFKAIVARASEIMPSNVFVYCKPITARPPVIIPIYNDEFWTKWFPRGRSKDLERFVRLAKSGYAYDKPQVVEDVDSARAKFMDALKIQQLEHMERSLNYCRKALNLGIRWRT